MAKTKDIPPKPCAYCGAPVLWKKVLGTLWDKPQYCNAACHRMDNRMRRQAKEVIGVAPDVLVNDHGVRIWTKAKPPVKQKK